MIEALSTILTTAGASIVTGFSTWIFTRRKYNQEVASENIKNLQESLDFYVKLSDDNNRRLGEILERNNQLEKQIIEVRKENFDLKEMVNNQTIQIETLTKQVELLLNKNN